MGIFIKVFIRVIFKTSYKPAVLLANRLKYVLKFF